MIETEITLNGINLYLTIRKTAITFEPLTQVENSSGMSLIIVVYFSSAVYFMTGCIISNRLEVAAP